MMPVPGKRRRFWRLGPARGVIATLAAGGFLVAAAANATAKDKKPEPPVAPPAPPPYEQSLDHLAGILGSVDYLRQLCGEKDADRWRDTMQKLIDTEAKGEEDRIRRLTASFNRGYRSFASVYTACTESAIAAEKRYRHEGATLADQIAAKYGN